MIDGSLLAAAATMHGELHGSDVKFAGVSTDTRSINRGELFVALQGPNFDGTEFVEKAAAAGAAGAVIARDIESDIPTIVVDDTLQALGELGSTWRQSLDATVIGITGSNGKTTLKELLAGCLSLSAETLATHGNFNNEIGLPLMLLRMSRTHRYAILEMGANHVGEIGYLTSLALPDVVAITNAGPAHLEGFGSVEGVAHAKGEILSCDKRPRAAVLNADDDYYDVWRSLVTDTQVVTFGLGAQANVRASDIEATETGSCFELHVPGRQVHVCLNLQGKHNVLNACAAAAIASVIGLGAEQIKEGLESVRPVQGRLEPVRSGSGALLFDDSYNANPVSVEAAAEFLAAQDGTSWLVLGDMGELGDDSQMLHARTGWAAREAGIDYLLATGSQSRHTAKSFGSNARWFESIEELIAHLQSAIGDGDCVLVKGSRSTRMERVVQALTRPSEQVGAA